MNVYLEKLNIIDNSGRRSGADRRQFSYAFHIPERRESPDRRDGKDRRTQPRTN